MVSREPSSYIPPVLPISLSYPFLPYRWHKPDTWESCLTLSFIHPQTPTFSQSFTKSYQLDLHFSRNSKPWLL